MTAPTDAALKAATEALERVRDYFDQRADADAQGDPMRYVGNEAMHRLRDCDTILAALKEREQAVAWGEFGAWAFEAFWQDGEPGDIDGGDAQDAAIKSGLLARTADVDAGATHAEGCEWQDGMPPSECSCYTPTLPPLSAIRAQGGDERSE